VNARASFRAARWLKLTADVFNLFDAHVNDIDYFYRSRLSGEPAAGVEDVHFHPAQNRSCRLSASFTF